MSDEITVKFKTTREKLSSLLQLQDVCPYGFVVFGVPLECPDPFGGMCNECAEDFIYRITVERTGEGDE